MDTLPLIAYINIYWKLFLVTFGLVILLINIESDIKQKYSFQSIIVDNAQTIRGFVLLLSIALAAFTILYGIVKEPSPLLSGTELVYNAVQIGRASCRERV